MKLYIKPAIKGRLLRGMLDPVSIGPEPRFGIVEFLILVAVISGLLALVRFLLAR